MKPLAPTHLPLPQVSAYSLLQYLVRHRWGELSAQEQLQVTQLAYQHMLDGARVACGACGCFGDWTGRVKDWVLLGGRSSSRSRSWRISTCSTVRARAAFGGMRRPGDTWVLPGAGAAAGRAAGWDILRRSQAAEPPPCSRVSSSLPPHPAVGHLGSSAAWALKSKSAMLLAAVVRQQGPDSFAQLLPQLLNAAAEGPMQVGRAGLRGFGV